MSLEICVYKLMYVLLDYRHENKYEIFASKYFLNFFFHLINKVLEVNDMFKV